MSALIEPKEYRVDSSRLASGTWCHSRNRLIGEGDIAASYSADKIAQGKIRKPFSWKNGLWVCTGTHFQSKGKSAEAYRLVPERFFDGEPTTYNEVAMLPFERRVKPEGFYHGMCVRHGKQSCVLVGPKALFLPQKESETQKQADLFESM